MSHKRSVMKPVTDLWWRYCRTNPENLCTFFWYRNLLFVKKCEQMSIWFDLCELQFNTISIVRAY
jgi:hypothetical protein